MHFSGIEQKLWSMNQSSNGFLPVVYGSIPTIYAHSVIECKCISTNWSLNGFMPAVYNFCMCRVPYMMLCDKDMMLHGKVWHYATMIWCYTMKMQANKHQTTVKRTSGYIGLELMHGGDIHLSIVNKAKITEPLPMPLQLQIHLCLQHWKVFSSWFLRVRWIPSSRDMQSLMTMCRRPTISYWGNALITFSPS